MGKAIKFGGLTCLHPLGDGQAYYFPGNEAYSIRSAVTVAEIDQTTLICEFIICELQICLEAIITSDNIFKMLIHTNVYMKEENTR
ncbi:MAG: hypothetical protein KAV87_54755 [Desulfobacteraceae bacterium]|nr:hypothetical protein [Desulfobacteraceae bacterium]